MGGSGSGQSGLPVDTFFQGEANNLLGPVINKTSKLDSVQQYIEQLLGHGLANQLGSSPNLSGLINSLLSGGNLNSTNIQALTRKGLKSQLSGTPDLSQNEVFFKTGLLEPALRGFDRSVAPNIKDYFAGQGATFSTARGNALTQARGDVFANAQSQLAQYNASAFESAKNRQLQALGIPMQQQLARIQGLQGLTGIQQGGFQSALAFLGIPTTDTIVSPSATSQILGAGGSAAGAYAGCVADKTLITRFDNSQINVEHLQPGEELYGIDGRCEKLLSIVVDLTQPCVKLYLEGDLSLVCSESHTLLRTSGGYTKAIDSLGEVIATANDNLKVTAIEHLAIMRVFKLVLDKAHAYLTNNIWSLE